MRTRTGASRRKKLTDETRLVESVVREGGFQQVDAYRYNSASIRVRVVDPRFDGLTHTKRARLVGPQLDQLPEDTQRDIIDLYLFTPDEMKQDDLGALLANNTEFENPRPSRL